MPFLILLVLQVESCGWLDLGGVDHLHHHRAMLSGYLSHQCPNHELLPIGAPTCHRLCTRMVSHKTIRQASL